MIIPNFSIILYPINYVFDFINVIATVLGNLPISNFQTISFDYISIIIYFLLLLFLSRICLANRKTKVVLSLPTLALLVLCLL